MRLRRSMRRALLAAATLTTSLLATTGIAHAVPNWTTSTITSTGPYVSGDVATYTLDIVNSGDAVGGTAGSFTLTEGGSPVEVVGTPTKADGPGGGADMSGQVTVAAASHTITILNAFGAGDARITISIRMPKRYDAQWNVRAGGTAGTQPLDVFDDDRQVAKGGPSWLVLDQLNAFPAFVVKDGTYVASMRLTNRGSATAEFPRINNPSIYGNTNSFSPTPPAFAPTGTFTSGCPTVVDAGKTCELGPLAPGASVDVQFTFTALTHYGYVYGDFQATAADRFSSDNVDVNFTIGDGGHAQTGMSLDGPVSAAGRSDLTFTGTLVHRSGSPLGASRLQIDARGFDANGAPAQSVASEVDSVKSITLSNGATCTKYVDTTVVPNVTDNNRFICPFAGLPAGGRLTYTIVANFPTSLPNMAGSIEVALDSVTTVTHGSAYRSVPLNVDRSVALDFGISGPAVIGTDRIAPVDITVTNKGNVQARWVQFDTSVPGGGASFDLASLPAGCWTWRNDQRITCMALTIEPGATATFRVKLRAAGTPGSFIVHILAGEWSAALDNSFYGDWMLNDRALAIKVVKASEAPFDGVTDAKVPTRTLTQLANAGLSSTFTCPDSCRATVQLRVNRLLAQRLGLVAPPRRAGRAKALPYVVIGTGTKTRTGSGQVVVTAKLARAYKAKVGKLRAPLAIQRVATVISTAADSKDARWTKTSTITVRPARPRR